MLRWSVQKWRYCVRFATESTVAMSSICISASKTSMSTASRTWTLNWLKVWLINLFFTRDKKKALDSALNTNASKSTEVLANPTTWVWLFRILSQLLVNASNVSRLLLDLRIAIPASTVQRLIVQLVSGTSNSTTSKNSSKCWPKSTKTGASEISKKKLIRFPEFR